MNEPYKTLQQMSITEILKQAVSLYRQHFLKLLGVVLPGVPIVIFCILILSTISSAPMPKAGEIPTEAVYMVPIMMLIFFLMYSFSTVVAAAGTIVISESFLGREIKIVDAYRKVRNRIFPLLGAIILTSVIIGLATTLGMFLCVIPGIIGWVYLSVWFGFIAQIVMLEGEGGMGAMKCSRTLIKEDSRKSLIVIGSVMAAILIAWIFLVAGNVMATQFNIVILSPVGNLFSISALILIEPIRFTATTLLYYDLRIRREGFDLKILEEELSTEI
ncbi:hypothetical protein H8E77_08300 [bacterium]|nr:hypothetical protein [bacterium]